jgi:hypothetical protein
MKRRDVIACEIAAESLCDSSFPPMSLFRPIPSPTKAHLQPDLAEAQPRGGRLIRDRRQICRRVCVK